MSRSAFICLYYAAWIVLAAVLLHVRHRLYRKDNSRSLVPLTQLHHFAYMLLALLPFIVALFMGVTHLKGATFWSLLGEDPSAAIRGFILRILLPSTVLNLTLTHFLISKNTSGKLNRDDLLRVWIQSLSVPIFSFIMAITAISLLHGLHINQAFGLALAVVCGLILPNLLLRWIGRSGTGKRLVMEESPLRDEIIAFLGNPAAAGPAIMIETLDESIEGEQLTFALRNQLTTWWRMYHPDHISVPLELLKRLEPEALSALLSIYVTRRKIVLGREYFPARMRRGRITSTAANVSIIFIIMALVIGLINFSPFVALPIYCVALIAMLAVSFRRWKRKRRLYKPELYFEAFALWTSRDASRRVEDFAAALAQFNFLLMWDQDAENSVALLLKSNAFATFLDTFGEARRNEIVGHMNRQVHRLANASATHPRICA